jgi:hypothetical protein
MFQVPWRPIAAAAQIQSLLQLAYDLPEDAAHSVQLDIGAAADAVSVTHG